MSGLANRESVMSAIRRVVEADPFLASYALLRALEAHDLAQVNAVYDDLMDMARNTNSISYARMRELLRERFGNI
jgi:hypothetical protein